MYDFYFGSKDEIAADPKTFLLGVKRTLPRWANSLPDSEFLILADLIENRVAKDGPVFVETGVGASTLLFIFYAMQRNGRVISWDTNSSKASFIRSVCADALEAVTGKATASHWTFVSSMSLAPYTGMEILEELTDRIDMSHHDSDHTWETVGNEVAAVMPFLVENGIVCVDDANQTTKHTYEPIVNMVRRKAGLKPIGPLPDNQCEPHVVTVPKLLSTRFRTIKNVTGDFANDLEQDLYYAWYGQDRKRMAEVGMERFETIVDRFAAWEVSERLPS